MSTLRCNNSLMSLNIYYFLKKAVVISSPHSERIYKISEKLNSIQLGVETERFQKLQQSNKKLEALEEQMEEIQDLFYGQLNQIREDVVKIQKIFEENKATKESAQEQKTLELNNIQAKFSNAFEVENSYRKDGESRIIKALDDKINLLKNEVVRESKNRNESIQQLQQSLAVDIPKIEEALKQEEQEREENDENVMKMAKNELVKIAQLLAIEKKNREDSETSIFEMLKDVVNRVKVELEGEQRIREDTESNLLTLIEDACNKLSTAANF